ncbi:acetate--CoA ligase [Marinilongibacter aquaticus]|uniref:acetate--CoA ligase n=1 Tax=Marinilongibacter aquaticus TaxID=2975157 RepID=UPI0021BD7058|nr:acetate--CoA ligase [Marinilongibacter aquaticus]UBM59847.1 acetate--CoA ligase [Marinilongibacter aquaticus]
MRINNFEEYQQAYKKSVEDPEGFWGEIANEFVWKKPFDKVLEWNFEEPNVKWFLGGKLNITENCLDRHVENKPQQTAIIWEPNDPSDEAVSLTYKVLHERVCRFANVLKKHGIKKGDRVCIYMPMIPELVVSVLACARIGAIHSVVFGGFSAKSISDRINDSQCKMVITSDGAVRGTKSIPMKETVDDAIVTCPSVEKVIVATRTRTPVSMIKGRDYWWEDEIKKVSADCPAEEMDAEDPLFILYTSGSTGKPKGVVHTCGGYMVYTTYSFVNAFQYNPGEVYFCTADIGWITGHSYIAYGPLAAGAINVMFEGVPTYPDAGRFWDIVDKHKVNIFYTAPTAIRALMGNGLEYLEGKDLSSLKVLGTVGEPINEEAWQWYHKYIGKEKCPIVDTWWQTETGGFMITPLAHITKTKPSYATLPLPGIQPALMDENGNEIEGNDVSGNLCIKFPWPSIIRTTWGDHERCKQVYFSSYPGKYFTGDGCLRDEDGYYRITGRVDDVINVSGHRIGTAEVEDALNMHLGVVESAVVGFPHDIKGQGIYAYMIMDKPVEDGEMLKKDILATVTRIIGPIAKPDHILFVNGLPKTRSGKIMRRILRKIAEGDVSNLGDTSTLLDPAVVDEIKAKVGLA